MAFDIVTDEDIARALRGCYTADASLVYMLDEATGKIKHVTVRHVSDLLERKDRLISKLSSMVEHLKKYDEERDIRLHARLIETARNEARNEVVEELFTKLKNAVGAYGIYDVISGMGTSAFNAVPWVEIINIFEEARKKQ